MQVEIINRELVDPSGLMTSATIAPVLFLADLRNQVLSSTPRHKEKEKTTWRDKRKVGTPMRTPKNRLKLADDLVMQIQVKDSGYDILWQCLAVQGEGLTANDFDERKRRGKGRVVFGFYIKQAGELWRISPGILTSSDAGLALKARVIALLTPDFMTGRIALLSPNCLICGRALKDPVSKMRLIGPECWGKAGVNAPILTRTPEQTASEVVERRYGLRLTDAGEQMLSGLTPHS